MSSARTIWNGRITWPFAFSLTLLLGACGGGGSSDSSGSDAASATTTTPTSSTKALGVMQIPVLGRGTVALLSGSGIDISFQSNRITDTGVRGSGGVRNFSATYRIRNAAYCATAGTCTANSTALTSLRFVAATVNGSAFALVKRFDGSDVTADVIAQIQPSQGVDVSGNLISANASSLVTYTTADLPTASTDVTGLLLYGYAVSSSSSSSSSSTALAASPASGQFDGIVTFSYQIPLEASATDDPFQASAVFEVVGD